MLTHFADYQASSCLKLDDSWFTVMKSAAIELRAVIYFIEWIWGLVVVAISLEISGKFVIFQFFSRRS